MNTNTKHPVQTKNQSSSPVNSTQEAIADILANILNVERDQLTPSARIEDDLGADSIDMVEIAMAVEEEFDLVISDEQMEPVKTVGDLQTAVEEALASRTPS